MLFLFLPFSNDGGAGSLSYFRTAEGAEVDFIAEQSRRCPRGYIVSRCPYVLELDEKITAIPWWSI
jgi:hypothetical protein